MTFLSDDALDHLKAVARAGPPDLEGAPDLEGGRYSIREEIGRGGMGTVYRAEDAQLERSVALKVLHENLLQDPQGEEGATERLRREAQVLARLEHPGVVPVHDVGLLPDGRTFYTMKLVEGERLDEGVAQGIPLPHRLRIFERLCEAVAFAHDRGILHRDLKPENVMVGPFGEVLVMDWGVARILASSERAHPEAGNATPSAEMEGRTAAGTVLGTPGYMAPEQAAGDRQTVDHRADIYALGAVLRYLLTGRHPWQKRGETEEEIPKRLEAVARRALAAQPVERYQTVLELAAEISRYLSGEPVAAYRETLRDRLLRFYRRHRIAILVVAAYILMRIVLFAVAGY